MAEKFKLSTKGQKLIELYAIMANEGYNRRDGTFEKEAYNKFQLAKFRHIILPHFKINNIKTVLDYGSGGSDWDRENFDEESKKSAKDFFTLDSIEKYEPARNIDQRNKSECVVCIDVLEHIFASDVPGVLNDIFSHAEKLVVLNVACYKASAMLPNDENAHITVRDPLWWKGVLDTVSIQFPAVNVVLICSPTFGSCEIFECWKADDWKHDEMFTIDMPKAKYFGDTPNKNNNIEVTKDQLFALIKSYIEQTPKNRIEVIDLISKSL
jgi:hypothetical protein